MRERDVRGAGAGDRDPASLAERVTSEYLAWVDRWEGTPGIRISREPDVTIRDTDFVHPFLNMAYRARLTDRDVEGRIEEIVARLGRGGRAFSWAIWPFDTPADLADRLVATGFSLVEDDPLMVRVVDAAPGPPAVAHPPVDGLAIERAEDPAAIEDLVAFIGGGIPGDRSDGGAFAATFRRLAAGADPWLRLLGGRVDGRLVATAGLFSGATMAGIVAVATDPAWRGRGIGHAMTVAAIDAARGLGFGTTMLRASPMGEPLYRRLGFEEVGRVRNLRWQGGAGTAGA